MLAQYAVTIGYYIIHIFMFVTKAFSICRLYKQRRLRTLKKNKTYLVTSSDQCSSVSLDCKTYNFVSEIKHLASHFNVHIFATNSAYSP